LQVLQGRAQLAGAAPLRAPAVAIGNFDGVHLGHRAIFRTAIEAARQRGAQAAVLTFDPHPARVLAPQLAPKLITPTWRKLELIAAAGIDVTCVLTFDRQLAATSPEEFVKGVLVDGLHARQVVVGHDFTFGKARAGTLEVLRQLGDRYGFEVLKLEAQKQGEVVASSTQVRQRVGGGDLEGAAAMLGRPFELWGEVVHGEERGRALGFPTANLAVENELWPCEGVYAAVAEVRTGPHAGWRGAAAVNIGTNPTFTADREGVQRRSTEAFLLDFQGELYGERMMLGLLSRLRGEQRFPSVGALVAQIERDVSQVRERWTSFKAREVDHE
jgi:riboflavin kinase/FMN adenylyltransferase